MPEAPDVDATVAKIEGLVEQLDKADPQLRLLAEEAIRLLLQLYAAGLARGIEIMGREQAVRLAEDKLVGSLLLLHGLHPVEASQRIEKALRSVERRLDGHTLHLAGIIDGVARIRVELNKATVPASLADAIERAVTDAAPDVGGVEIEGLLQPGPSLVQITPAVSY